jgi:hypothetical protein
MIKTNHYKDYEMKIYIKILYQEEPQVQIDTGCWSLDPGVKYNSFFELTRIRHPVSRRVEQKGTC